MRLPEGCGSWSDKVVRLNRSLYGLKEASRLWHINLTCMKTLGFEQCPRVFFQCYNICSGTYGWYFCHRA